MSTPVVPVPKRSHAQCIPAILTWKDPAKTGVVFAEVLGAIALLRFGGLLRFGLKLVYWAIAITGIAEFVTRYIHGSNKGLVASYRPSRYFNIPQASIEKYAAAAAGTAVAAVSDVQKLLDAEDLGLSAAAFVFVFVLYGLTGILSLTTLIIVLTISAFTLPKVYLVFEKEIDEVLAHLHKQAGDHYANAHAQVRKAAGPHIDVAKKHIGTVATAVGINRGGFPSETNTTKPVPVTSVPGPAAKSPEPVVPKQPKVSAEAAEILNTHPDVHQFDSVPTLVGNVSLKDIKDVKTHPELQNYDSVPTLAGNVSLKDVQEAVAADASATGAHGAPHGTTDAFPSF